MECYKRSDVENIISKLLKEPCYYHEGEDFYSGVCAVESEIVDLEVIVLENSTEKVATWSPAYKGLLDSDYRCSNCKTLAEEGNSGCYNRLTNYCPQCGCHMIWR